MTILILCAALLQQDPRDRLIQSIRDTDRDAVVTALEQLAAGNTTKAVRSMLYALPRCRDHFTALHGRVIAVRKDFDRIETGMCLTKPEEDEKAKALTDARERLIRANKAAIEGEKIYLAVRQALGKLPASTASLLATEAEGSRSWMLKCEIYQALADMGARELLEAAVDTEKDPIVLAALLRAAPPEKAKAHLAHDQWQVRLGALSGLGQSKESVGAIIDALPTADARFKMSAVATLVGLTQTELPPDAGVWKDWWTANREDFETGRYNPSAMKSLPGPGRTTFYEIPITSTRICFVIDRSKSMTLGGRFDKAKSELKLLLDRLPDESRVNIVFFGESTSSWSKTTRLLDKSNRRDAVRFVESQSFEDGTNLLLAMEKALSSVGNSETGSLRADGADTIIVLSDGEPTVGRLVNDELIARVVARRAEFLRPIIHTVRLGGEAPAMRLMSELTGGESRQK